MRWASGAAAGLLLAGVAILALAVATQEAHLALVVFVPLVYGSSILFGVGIAVFVAGFVALPFALAGALPPPVDRPASTAPPTGVRAGGFVLIGPVPIVWGSHRTLPRRSRALLAVAGAGLLALAVVLWILSVG